MPCLDVDDRGGAEGMRCLDVDDRGGAEGMSALLSISVDDKRRRLAAICAHADALLALQVLALGLQRRGRPSSSARLNSAMSCVACRWPSTSSRPPIQVEQCRRFLARGAGDDLLRACRSAWSSTRVPRGSVGMERRHAPVEAMPPGASYARASGEPSITTSAPQAISLRDVAAVAHAAVGDHLARTRRSPACAAERAAATSADLAVACGTPMPSTPPRVVHAAPGPTPTSTPAAPVRIRCRARASRRRSRRRRRPEWARARG